MKIVLMLVIMTSNPNGSSYTEFDAIGFKEMKKCQESLQPIMKKLTEQFDKVQADCVEREVY